MNAAAPHPFAAALSAAIDRYHDVLTAYVDRGGEDHLALVDRMVRRGAVFAGRPICSLLRPDFLLRPQHELMTRALRHFRSAVRKAKDEILASPEDEVQPLLRACKARVVCVVNSFRAKLLDKKMLFALLHDARVSARFSPEEREAIARHVPWTRRVEQTRTTGPDGAPIDLVPWIAEHRTELVLKPNDEVGGRGVVIGANVEPSVWERALKLALVDPSVVQRRVPLPSAMFPEVGAAGELFFSRRYLELDAYLFRGDFRGVLTRLAATTLCNVHAGAGTVPTFIIECDPR